MAGSFTTFSHPHPLFLMMPQNDPILKGEMMFRGVKQNLIRTSNLHDTIVERSLHFVFLFLHSSCTTRHPHPHSHLNQPTSPLQNSFYQTNQSCRTIRENVWICISPGNGEFDLDESDVDVFNTCILMSTVRRPIVSFMLRIMPRFKSVWWMWTKRPAESLEMFATMLSVVP